MIKFNDLEAFEIEEMAINDKENLDIYIKALYDKHQYKRAIKLFDNNYDDNMFENNNKINNDFIFSNRVSQNTFAFSYMTAPTPEKNYRKANLYNIIGLSYKNISNDEKFKEYMNKASKYGCADSYAHLGLYYLSCDTPDPNMAMRYFDIAKQSNSEYVNILLAELYFYGLYGFEQSNEMAKDYLKKADPENEFVINLKNKLN